MLFLGSIKVKGCCSKTHWLHFPIVEVASWDIHSKPIEANFSQIEQCGLLIVHFDILTIFNQTYFHKCLLHWTMAVFAIHVVLQSCFNIKVPLMLMPCVKKCNNDLKTFIWQPLQTHPILPPLTCHNMHQIQNAHAQSQKCKKKQQIIQKQKYTDTQSLSI